MDRLTRSSLAGFVAVLALHLATVSATSGFTISYCSLQNTATDFKAIDWEWQSNGWCHDRCNQEGTYAFAVVQYRNCWCSNYIPEEQEDSGDCNKDCPGFPVEKCGDKDKGLYGYIELANAPSGTKGTSEPTSTNSAKPSETTTPTTLQTTTPSAETSAADPQTSVRIVTESGRVVTQTIVTSPTSTPILSQTPQKKSNAGAIAGGVVGGIAVIAAVVGGIFFLLLRRRRQQDQQEEEDPSGVQRNTSTMSKAGLLRGEKSPQYPPPIATSFNRRQSRTMLDSESISPISGSERRNSRPLVFDQRLNPSTIMRLDNSSRDSIGTIDDSADLSRTLVIRNN